MFGCVLGYDTRMVDLHPSPEKFFCAPLLNVVGVVIDFGYEYTAIQYIFYYQAPGESRGCCRVHLNTGHDFLEVYVHWLGLATNEACALCGNIRIDGDHLLQSTGHDEYPTNDTVSRHWEARRQMVKKPSMSVG
ncbi:reverse transcriptase [Trichonephila clavipes]|nr:reverse transcriptase [Trichonephila clavipes]